MWPTIPSSANKFRFWKANFAADFELAKRGVDLRDSQGFTAAQNFISAGEGKREMDEIRRIIGAMEQHEAGLLEERSIESAQSSRQTCV